MRKGVQGLSTCTVFGRRVCTLAILELLYYIMQVGYVPLPLGVMHNCHKQQCKHTPVSTPKRRCDLRCRCACACKQLRWHAYCIDGSCIEPVHLYGQLLHAHAEPPAGLLPAFGCVSVARGDQSPRCATRHRRAAGQVPAAGGPSRCASRNSAAAAVLHTVLWRTVPVCASSCPLLAQCWP